MSFLKPLLYFSLLFLPFFQSRPLWLLYVLFVVCTFLLQKKRQAPTSHALLLRDLELAYGKMERGMHPVKAMEGIKLPTSFLLMSPDNPAFTLPILHKQIRSVKQQVMIQVETKRISRQALMKMEIMTFLPGLIQLLLVSFMGQEKRNLLLDAFFLTLYFASYQVNKFFAREVS